MQADKELDARGLNCPMPILKTKKMPAGMAMAWRICLNRLACLNFSVMGRIRNMASARLGQA